MFFIRLAMDCQLILQIVCMSPFFAVCKNSTQDNNKEEGGDVVMGGRPGEVADREELGGCGSGRSIGGFGSMLGPPPGNVQDCKKETDKYGQFRSLPHFYVQLPRSGQRG